MRLCFQDYPVKQVIWGERCSYTDGTLTVNTDELNRFLIDNQDLECVNLDYWDIANAKTPTRIVKVRDVLPAQTRLDKDAIDYPGFLGGMQLVGEGNTARLTDFSLLGVNEMQHRHNMVIDKLGSGADLSPYESHCHLIFRISKKSDDVTDSEYHLAFKRIGLRVGSYLARLADASNSKGNYRYYDWGKAAPTLPRIVYFCMVTTHQRIDYGEPILYGDDCAGILPTVLHPNEVLDGALLSPNFRVHVDTYSVIRNRVIEELYSQHGKTINLVAVVPYICYVTYRDKIRTDLMAANIAKEILYADGAVITKVGGGVGETDFVNIIGHLEDREIKTVGLCFNQEGVDKLGRHVAEMTLQSHKLYSLISCGIMSQPAPLSLTNIDSKIRVIGGAVNEDPVLVQHAAIASDAPPQDASKLCEVNFMAFGGSNNQLGIAKLGVIHTDQGDVTVAHPEGTAAKRAVSLLIRRLNNEPFETEIPIHMGERSIPAPAVQGKIKLAILTDGGLIRKGNPDNVPNGGNKDWYRIDLHDCNSLTQDKFEGHHWGYSVTCINEDPNRLIPWDALREAEKSGACELYNIVFSVSGAGIMTDGAIFLGQSLLEEMKSSGVNAILLVSTASHSTKSGSVAAHELEKGGIAIAHIAPLADVALSSGSNRVIIGCEVGCPCSKPDEERREYLKRKRLVRRVLEVLRTDITAGRTFEV